ACKMFSRWLWRQGRLPDDPLAGLSRWNSEVDRKVIRRAFSEAELGRLIETAEASQKSFRGLSGPDRAALYILASATGLRAKELAALTLSDLSLETAPPTVRVRAAYAKNRREDVLPLPLQAAEYLRRWLANRPTIPLPSARLWPGSWPQKAARMLQIDLNAAGISPVTPAGRLDFHALRATYATALARAGVNLQTAQALLRHSDPKLTAKTYTRLGITDLGAAVAFLRLTGEKAEARSQEQK
ncbi:MAG: site-specific integrase, partial [Thermoguttaceae bacterium]|nr:site-specific integrase [Thermoguttaceae bacterium]